MRTINQYRLFAYATRVTRMMLAGNSNPQPSRHNRKPYRTAKQKREARRTCRRADDGAYYSSAPVSFHPAPRGEREE